MRFELEGSAMVHSVHAPGDQAIRCSCDRDGELNFYLGADELCSVGLKDLDTPEQLAEAFARVARAYYTEGWSMRGYCLRRALGLGHNGSRAVYVVENFDHYR